jgi:hypothetical protein
VALSKKQVQNIIARYLDANPRTQIPALKMSVEDKLKSDGVIGQMARSEQNYTQFWEERISDEDALLINEVIYDFLYGRIITPGYNRDNLDLPWVHVSRPEELKKYL